LLGDLLFGRPEYAYENTVRTLDQEVSEIVRRRILSSKGFYRVSNECPR